MFVLLWRLLGEERPIHSDAHEPQPCQLEFLIDVVTVQEALLELACVPLPMLHVLDFLIRPSEHLVAEADDEEREERAEQRKDKFEKEQKKDPKPSCRPGVACGQR